MKHSDWTLQNYFVTEIVELGPSGWLMENPVETEHMGTEHIHWESLVSLDSFETNPGQTGKGNDDLLKWLLRGWVDFDGSELGHSEPDLKIVEERFVIAHETHLARFHNMTVHCVETGHFGIDNDLVCQVCSVPLVENVHAWKKITTFKLTRLEW